jgi:hypothetical protein
MSGGHFDYEDWHIKEIAEKIAQDLEYNDISYDNPVIIDGQKKYGYQLESDIVEFMKKAVHQLQQLSTIVHEYDWMISGDTGPETFRERVGVK